MGAQKLEYQGRVKDGVIKLPKSLRKEIVQLFDGKPITVIIKRTARKRSSPQNRWYWAVLTFLLPFIKDADPENNLTLKEEDLHEFFKDRFLGKVDKAINDHGDTMQISRSTTDLSKDEFSEYMDHIEKFALEFFSVQIPLPEQQMEAF